MVLTDETLKYFSSIPFRVRAAIAQSQSMVPFVYDDEPFFPAYQAMKNLWRKRDSQRKIISSFKISKKTLKALDNDFETYGTVGLLPKLSFRKVDIMLEKLVVLIKTVRPHENASLALRLANALKIHGASLDIIRHIQRCHGYGQRMDENDKNYFQELQHILTSVHKQNQKPLLVHTSKNRAHTFFNYEKDHFQHRVELFQELSSIHKRRQTRPILRQYGIAPNRFYELKNRYMQYGIWGLVDLIQKGQKGEKISSELELQIIEERLMKPSLSTAKIIRELELKCSRARVQTIYSKWNLARHKESIALRGVVSRPIPEKISIETKKIDRSAKIQFPNLIKTASLKVNQSFERFVNKLSYKKVIINNPGAILIAPFLEQLGVVEALHTFGPSSLRSAEITNPVILNVLRIISGFPTIHDYTNNADRSVAIAAGLSLNPVRSRFYDSLDEMRFEHLQKLRNDTGCRARELSIIDGSEIAIDYHCDRSDSRFHYDKRFSKSPDSSGKNMVYAHRPQILWDSINNTIINIAYCEGGSRAPSALYKFCEENLYKIIDPDAVQEIYADSEYTGEKQIIYLSIQTHTDITMCLKQNPKIKKWKEQTIQNDGWEMYGENYRIVSQDFALAETGKPFRFIVKQNIESGEVRCFGSTHIEYSPKKILDSYHIRWPVESGIKDLIENYYLNKPTGTSPEKVETHYYCVMVARLCIDYFRSLLCTPEWRTPEEWECVLSTIRTSIFCNQNCELSLHESGDLMITYLDGDRYGIKRHLAELLQRRKSKGLNQVSWWGGKGVQVEIKDQFDF